MSHSLSNRQDSVRGPVGWDVEITQQQTTAKRIMPFKWMNMACFFEELLLLLLLMLSIIQIERCRLVGCRHEELLKARGYNLKDGARRWRVGKSLRWQLLLLMLFRLFLYVFGIIFHWRTIRVSRLFSISTDIVRFLMMPANASCFNLPGNPWESADS